MIDRLLSEVLARWAVAGLQICRRENQECRWWEVQAKSSFGTPNLVHWLLGTDADLSRCPTCVANMISSDAYWSYCGFTRVHKVLNITRELRVGLSCSISGLYITQYKVWNHEIQTNLFVQLVSCHWVTRYCITECSNHQHHSLGDWVHLPITFENMAFCRALEWWDQRYKTRVSWVLYMFVQGKGLASFSGVNLWLIWPQGERGYLKS